jgi:serine/threonine-protein kinase PknG
LYRTLQKATAPNPDDRFQTADELRTQLIGVLREVVAVDSDQPAAAHSSPSELFGAPTATGAELSWTDLPLLRIDRADAAATWLAGVSLGAPDQRLRVLEQAPEQTVEVQLAKARAAIEAGQFVDAGRLIEDLLTANPWEWRAVWLSGLAALAQGQPEAAETSFNTVLGQVPGELGPKLALALACERSGVPDVAEYLYAVCAATDANYVAPAAFGLARTREIRDDTQSAIAALDLVAPTSGAYIEARRRRAELLSAPGRGLSDLAQAAASIENLAINPRDRQVALLGILTAAISEVERNGEQPAVRIVADVPATETALRTAAERAYRELATLTPDHAARVELIDWANQIRPRTMV